MNKVIRYLLSGVILAYFGLKDIQNFNLLYHGFALAVSFASFALAAVEWNRKKSS